VEASTDTGITIEHVWLLKSRVEILDPTAKTEYNLRLVALERTETPDGKTLALQAVFDLMRGVENPMLLFTCEFVAHYARKDDSGLAWKDFSSALALAHIIPYLREYVNNITNRLPTPVLMLAPLNTYAMIADYEECRHRAGNSGTMQVPE